jgi:predicted RNA-binding Zn ribbon-like protein
VALAGGGTPDDGDLAALDAAQREAFGQRRLVAEGRSFRWDWREGLVLDRVRWRVAESASELLTLGDLGRLRRCAGEDCTRLFLDTSRGGRRRWCDMSHCGNIAKARRFRTRHLEGGQPR